MRRHPRTFTEAQILDELRTLEQGSSFALNEDLLAELIEEHGADRLHELVYYPGVIVFGDVQVPDG